MLTNDWKGGECDRISLASSVMAQHMLAELKQIFSSSAKTVNQIIPIKDLYQIK